jgi:hypothetical protein
MITGGQPCGLLASPRGTPTNDCPCSSDDLWLMSEELNQKNLTLVIIGIEPSVTVCDDFYGALAKNTGKWFYKIFFFTEDLLFRRRIYSINQC